MTRAEEEQTKLTASALNTLSTAMVTIGVLAPTAALLYGLSSPQAPWWIFVLSAAGWVFLGATLHLVARRLLRSIGS